MPKIVDRQTGEIRDATAEEAQQAFQSGAAGFAKGSTVNVVGPDGSLGNVAPEDVDRALSDGYQIAGDDIVAAEKSRIEHSTIEQQAKAALEGAGRGLTLGLSDAALTASGLVEADEMKARKEANPGIAIGSELTGAIAPLLLSGGGSAAAQGGAAALKGGGAAVKAAGFLPRGVAAVGRGAEAATGALLGSRSTTLVGRAAKAAVGGAVEGAIVGGGQAISQAALDDVELTAEQLLAHAGDGAMLGAIAGGGLTAAGGIAVGTAKAAGRSAAKVGRVVRDKARDVAPDEFKRYFSREGFSEAVDELRGSASWRAINGPGGGKKFVEQLDELGGMDKVGQIGLDLGIVTKTGSAADRAEAAKRVYGELSDEFAAKVRQVAPEAVTKSEGRAAFRALGATRADIKKAEKFGGGIEAVGNRLREMDIVKRGRGVDEIAEIAERKVDELGEQIGQVMTKLDAEGAEKVTNEAIHDALEKQVLKPLTASGSSAMKRTASTVRRELESRGLMRRLIKDDQGAMVLEPPKAFGFEDLHRSRAQLQSEMGKFDQATKAVVTDTYRNASREVERILEAAVDAGGTASTAAYKPLKLNYAAAKDALEISRKAIDNGAAGKKAWDPLESVTRAFQDADDAIEGKFDDLVKASAPDEAPALIELRENMQATRLMAAASEAALERQGANKALSLSDMQVAQAASISEAVIGGGIDPGTIAAGLLFGVGNKIVRERGAAFVAGGLQSLRAAQKATSGAVAIERRMDDAVSGMLSGARRAVAREAVRADAGGSREKRFEAKLEAVQAATPQAITAAVSRTMGDHTHPELIGAYTQTAARAAEFLRSKAPVSPPRTTAQPHLPQRSRVSPRDQSRFLRYAKAVENPVSVLEDASRGKLTAEGVEALQVVYPRMHERMTQRAFDALTRMDTRISRQKATQLSLLLGRPLHFTLEPQFLSWAQDAYADSPSEPEDQGLAPSRMSAPELSSSHKTASEQTETRR